MKFFFILFFFICITITAQAEDTTQNPVSPSGIDQQLSLFKVEPWAKADVDFWIRVYSEFSSDQGVIHDSKYMDHIFEVVDITGMSTQQRKAKVRSRVSYWKNILLAVDRKTKKNLVIEVADEKKVLELYGYLKDPERFRLAAGKKRLRMQVGQRDRFIEAIYYSGRYLADMEEVFKKEGLPIELTRIPFVESSFNIKARSKVGASGVWQFMRYTGKRFLKINTIIDERNDPVKSTEAAARFLKECHGYLDSWVLAIVAYNHGPGGMMKAVKKTDSTDLKEIIDEYKNKRFGFASRNYYLEFLAALQVEKNADKYFGPIPRATKLKYVTVALAESLRWDVLIQHMGLDYDQMEELNPGFSAQIYKSKIKMPRGTKIQLPDNWGSDLGGPREAFWKKFLEIPIEKKEN
jgi:membrane-bound lytic murein transglycosylase D